MIISRIEGGLGNQMFQYAFGYYAAKRHDTELILDLGSYQAGPQHGYLLNRFQITAAACEMRCQDKIPARYRVNSSGIGTKTLELLGLGRALKRFKEKPFGFHSRYLQVPNDSYLVGNWQSSKFFPGIEDELRSCFRLRKLVTKQTEEVGKRISGSRSLALHIRRGDYISNSSAAAIYEHLTLDYYRECARRFAESHTETELFVFSNDIGWCRQELKLPWKTHYVDHNTADTAHEDLWLMAKAAGVVIANSTFSWWAAWLNNRAGREVYAPQSWFRPGVLDDSEILCDGWIQVDDPQPRQAA